MPRKKKEVYRKTVQTTNGQLNVFVFERVRKSKDGSEYYTEAYNTKAEHVLGVSTKEYRAADSEYSPEEVIARVVARTIEKYEVKTLAPREKVDFAAAFSEIPEESRSLLYPHTWGDSVRRSAMSFYINNSIDIIQGILDAKFIDEAVLQHAQEQLIKVVKGNQNVRKNILQDNDAQKISEQAIDEALKQLDAAAKKTAERRLVELNTIYQASRLLLPEYNLPLIQLPHIILDKVVPVEQCKALPREFLVKLATILAWEVEHTPLALGGILLLCCLLRPSEACAPKYGDILDFGSFGVYAVLTKVDSVTVEVVNALKSTAAARIIIIPKFGMDAMRRRKALLMQSGLSEEEVNKAYAVSRCGNPFKPAGPQELSHYTKKWMEMLGCTDEFWASLSLLMAQEPDKDEYGRILADPTAYSLRRSGCSNLVNCAAAPRLPGNQIPLFVLVDLIMGHKLQNQDIEWKKWMCREDNWPLVAQMMETIILDPEHSAHPAFSQLCNELFPAKICHTHQKVSVSSAAARHSITIRCHSTDNILVRIPSKGKLCMHRQVVIGKEDSSMPVIQEQTDRAFYAKAINNARKIYAKERGVSIEPKESEPIQGDQTDPGKTTC